MNDVIVYFSIIIASGVMFQLMWEMLAKLVLRWIQISFPGRLTDDYCRRTQQFAETYDQSSTVPLIDIVPEEVISIKADYDVKTLMSEIKEEIKKEI